MTVGTLADLGALEGMPSLPSLQRFIAAHADFPVIQRGRYGLPYQLDLEIAAAYVRAHWRDGRRRTSEEQEQHEASLTRQPCLPGFEIDPAGAATR